MDTITLFLSFWPLFLIKKGLYLKKAPLEKINLTKVSTQYIQ